MNTIDIIRAWKDELFRKSLSKDEISLLPDHPSGELLLTEEEMLHANGGIQMRTGDPCDPTCRVC